MSIEQSSTVRGVLAGKIIVVTGAGQGIGTAYARRLARDGATVVLTDINEQGLADAVRRLASEGLAVGQFAMNVADARDVGAFADWIGEQYGRLDGLINNAAIFSALTLKPFWEIEEQEWDRVMAVNVKGPWLLVKALLPHLRRSPGASLVNIGSDAAWMGKTGYLHYVASKGGIFGMTNAMSRELGAYNIRVNSLSPGFIETAVPRATFTQEQLAAILKSQALARTADTGDMVGVASFLMSDDSRWITGQTLHINGGMMNH
ncbi:SDR family oxidoreductase [Pigmentiphaga sp. H8]|uniref:SDR family NAD(P)-dependent oxidoreductase n=1 Tax=unclassified Pigmentiphaga TaxID=2626614 RepID=UPI000F594AA8|nr:SDR family oxidoreductase [Pigmentiphaga sp. H8]AZG10964.1 SDR family oxidoreductase [Pigmentiphaga sp. H8]